MRWLRTSCMIFIFKKRKLKRNFHGLMQGLIGQIYCSGEKSENRVSCTYSELDGSDLFLRRENWKEKFMHLFRTWRVRYIFKKRKLRGEFHGLIQDLMGQIYFLREKIENRISCPYSGVDRSDLFLRRENSKQNFMHIFRTWWFISIFKKRKSKRKFHALNQDLMGQISC